MILASRRVVSRLASRRHLLAVRMSLSSSSPPSDRPSPSTSSCPAQLPRPTLYTPSGLPAEARRKLEQVVESWLPPPGVGAGGDDGAKVPRPAFAPLEDCGAVSGRDGGAFNVGTFAEGLKTRSVGRTLLYAPWMTSTQTVVSERVRGCGSEVVCVADRQTNGRGRGGNVWESPAGCLLFTFKSMLPASAGARLPFLQYLVTLAMVRAVKGSAVGGRVGARIKWPNDVYTADGAVKLGGVLCQSSIHGGKFEVVTGVGLNVANDTPTTCLNTLARGAAAADGDTLARGAAAADGGGGGAAAAAAAAAATTTKTTTRDEAAKEPKRRDESEGGAIKPAAPAVEGTDIPHVLQAAAASSAAAAAATLADDTSSKLGLGGEGIAAADDVATTREEILSLFLSNWEPMLDLFRQRGFEPFLDEYHAAWLHSNQRVTVRGPAAGPAAGGDAAGSADSADAADPPAGLRRVVIKGVSPKSAALVAIDDDNGQRCELYPDGNRFDFFQGLIYQRM